MKTSPIISVIVPVYNTEEFLERCLKSLIHQTYQELEIIIVNDASTDNSKEIIEKFAASDSRIKCVEHDVNRGLFQARITGVSASSGEYIAFVDSDDYVSIDWFRLLAVKAVEEHADITIGDWCFEYETGWREYLNLDPFRIQDVHFNGPEIIREFMRQEGRCFSWHVVWNKLYSKELWNRCENDFIDFSKEHGHMLMWEDVAFSSGFWNCANLVVNTHGANYFYYIHKTASTSRFSTQQRSRGQKYITDASASMFFMEKMLKKYNNYFLYESNYKNWLTHCKATIYKDLVTDLSSKVYLKAISDTFGNIDKNEFEYNNFFYDYRTQLSTPFEWYEDLKAAIASEETELVSFDIFDTLVQRPFCEPTDLFGILSDKFNELEGTSSYIDFKNIRILAESECRKKYGLYHPSVEEITLDEIYSYIIANYSFPKETILKVKEYEIELEYEFCHQRKTGKELFDLALYCGKRIIICSDMYLPLKTIEAILHKNGYFSYNAIYVSSEIKLTKYSGRLFDYICKDLNIPPKRRKCCVHIGDNWVSDVEKPKQRGWNAYQLPKSIDIYEGRNSGIYSGDFYKNVMQNTFHLTDTYWAQHDFLGLSAVHGLIANRLYDNPFVSINPNSDFNINPYTIGYLVLGPHLLALVQWIEQNRKELNGKKVHFVARDGYLVKKAYDTYYKGNTSSNYIRLSRKSLLLADVDSVSDLYSIITKANITNLSPKKLELFLTPILDANKLPKVHEILCQNKLAYTRKFASIIEYNLALKIYIDYAVDISLLPLYKADLKEYFSELISPGDLLFDVGYSGRPEAALSNILGFPVNSLYIHTLKDLCNKRQKRYDCICRTFYDYKPAITGVMREHLLMELGPSTIGYQKQNGTLVPVLEEKKESYTVDYVTQIIQEAAIDFIKDYIHLFDKYSSCMYARRYDLSLPLEYYLHNSKELDRQIFATMEFEDDMGEGRTISALEFWNNEIAQRELHCKTSNCTTEVIPNLYMDGLFIKFYQLINKKCPYGSKQRELIKKIARVFIH